MVTILYQDDDILAVLKPEGLASIPEGNRPPEDHQLAEEPVIGGQLPGSRPQGPGSETGRSLQPRTPGDCLLWRLEAMAGEKLYVVHRLDKDVSGVILFARNSAAHKSLNEQFSRRTVHKTYVALLHGLLAEPRGTIDRAIRQFGSGRMGVDAQRGKPSQTDFQVLDTYEGYTYVEAYPRTGRRHQLRVHFYSIGHPIVGDMRYGRPLPQVESSRRNFSRLMLHAQEIAFRLPSGRDLTVFAPPPSTFVALLAEASSPAADD